MLVMGRESVFPQGSLGIMLQIALLLYCSFPLHVKCLRVLQYGSSVYQIEYVEE